MRNEVQPIAAVQGAPCANLEALGRIVGDDPQRLLEVTVQRGQAEWVDTRGVVRVSPLDLQTERKIAQTCQRVIAGEQEDGKHANTVLYCNVRCNVILTQCMEIMNSLHNARERERERELRRRRKPDPKLIIRTLNARQASVGAARRPRCADGGNPRRAASTASS